MKIRTITNKVVLSGVLALLFVLSGCSSLIKLKEKDDGILDPAQDILYLPCSPLAVRPVTVGEEYAKLGNTIYYTIKYETPEDFICDKADGVSYVFRNSKLEDITIHNFEPIAAFIYIEGTASLHVGTLYASGEFLPDELKDDNMQDDSALVYAIRDALKQGERVEVSANDINPENDYYLRLLSAKYPGLYYTVVFYTDNKGTAYLKDRRTGESVYAPEELRLRILG